MHPTSQSLQEYTEVATQYDAIRKLLQAPAPQHTVQMLARVGYTMVGEARVGPAPRRGLSALIAEPDTRPAQKRKSATAHDRW